jgi:hypothetical protein
MLLLLFNTTRTRSGPPSTRATITMDGGVADTARAMLVLFNTTRKTSGPTLLMLFNTTRMISGPPSTRAAIAMDGGADTACYSAINERTQRSQVPSPCWRVPLPWSCYKIRW